MPGVQGIYSEQQHIKDCEQLRREVLTVCTSEQTIPVSAGFIIIISVTLSVLIACS